MNFVYYCGWRFFRTFYKVYFRAEWFNAERVPVSGSVILASNHASILDPPLVGTALNRGISYLARESIFRFPGVGWVLRNWDAVPVDRDGGGARGLKAIMDRLRAGGGIVLFPEGTRSLDGKLLPARSGIGLTVLKSSAPVVPVRVFGTFEAYSKDMMIPRPRKIMAKYGVPMDFASQRAEAKTCSKARLKEIYQEVANEIMVQVASLEPCEDKASFP